MENKTCKTCINNDDGLCDRKELLKRMGNNK